MEVKCARAMYIVTYRVRCFGISVLYLLLSLALGSGLVSSPELLLDAAAGLYTRR